MTAKEMFEKLGYRKTSQLNSKDEIVEIKYTSGWQEIIFDLQFKDIKYDIEFNGLKILKAITKQIEELGWLNEVE